MQFAALASSLLASVLHGQEATPAPAEGAKQEDVVELSAFQVTSERDYGYRAANSISGTRTNTPIKDVPLSIAVFTKDLYEDLGITNQVDLEKYNAALTNGGADRFSDNVIQQAYNNFLFRGFTQNWGLRDGIREYDPVDTQALARVEVVKGSVGGLYGVSYAGGVMNNISKDVDFSKNFAAIRTTVGGEGDWRATVDANYSGKIAAGGTFGVRFNGAKSVTKDVRAHSKGDIALSNIVLSWALPTHTTIKFMAEKGYRGKPTDLGYFLRSGVSPGSSIPLQADHPEISYDWNWADGKNKRSLDTTLYRGTIEQKVGKDFEFTGYVQFSERKQIDSDGFTAPDNTSGGVGSWETGFAGWNPTANTITSVYNYRDWSNSMHSYGATGIYRLETGPVKHTFAFGANAWGESFVSRHNYGNWATTQKAVFAVAEGVDINTPWGIPDDVKIADGGYSHERNSNDNQFISWQTSSFNNRLNTTIGLNRTNLRVIQWPNGEAATPSNDVKMSSDSPIIGANYAVTDEVSVFGVYGKSLFPTTDKDSFGRFLPPEKGKAKEVGVKVELLKGKINGTISYYDIDKAGKVFDPTAPNANAGQTGDWVAGNAANSKGFEVDLQLQPTRELQIVVSYAHNTSSPKAPQYRENQGSILTKYTFATGDLKGAFVGLGLYGGSKSYQGATNGVEQYEPSRISADAFVGYRTKLSNYPVVVQLNVNNLLKTDDYIGWKDTGSTSVVSTERFAISTPIVYKLTFGIDL